MNTELLAQGLLALLVYMSFWFAFAKAFKRLAIVDIAWGGGFILLACMVVAQEKSARTMLIAFLVTIWGSRLIYHLGRRVIKNGEDKRYVELSKKWQGNFWLRAYLSVFVLQGVLVLIVGLPIIVASNEQNENLGILSVLGTAIWAVGFIIESTADRQLRKFTSKKSNNGKIMDQGLWVYSRHPNYFGELTQWWGIAIIALQVKNGWIGLIGPLTLTYLILFVSGIPPIERQKKKDPAYLRYMKRTSPLIPWPPKT